MSIFLFPSFAGQKDEPLRASAPPHRDKIADKTNVNANESLPEMVDQPRIEAREGFERGGVAEVERWRKKLSFLAKRVRPGANGHDGFPKLLMLNKKQHVMEES